MYIARWFLVVFVIVALAAVVAGQSGLLKGHAPANLGVRDGRLAPPSRTPNSVSSEARLHPDNPMHDEAAIAPLRLEGNGAQTLAKILEIVGAMDGAEVIERRPDYLYVQFTTPVMKFVDDAEFRFDPAAQVIQVRSASRLGSKDFGTNRDRIEAIRRRLAGL